MKHLLIIKAGETFPELASQLGDFEDWIEYGLAPHDIPIKVLDPRNGEMLPAACDIAGAVITGSHAMVTDRAPWSEALAAWLNGVVVHGTPVLGICYGHQLLAYALGGEVGYHPQGLEIGTVPVRPTEAAANDALFHGLPCSFPAHAVHRQSVYRLPRQAVLLASNGFERHHAFRIGDAAWGVQFHPEFSSYVMRTYVARLAEELTRDGRNADMVAAGISGTDTAATILQRFGSVVSQHQLHS